MSELASWNGEQPQVKLLDPVLFEQLGAGSAGYTELLLAEYGRPEQVAAWRDGRPYVAELAENSAGQ